MHKAKQKLAFALFNPLFTANLMSYPLECFQLHYAGVRRSEVTKLIKDGAVVTIGTIRQELLSGVSDILQFNRLKDIFSAFEDIPLESKHFIKAAEFSNICRKKGIQGSTIDFLICAVATIENLIVFTTDRDFEYYRKHLPVKLL